MTTKHSAVVLKYCSQNSNIKALCLLYPFCIEKPTLIAAIIYGYFKTLNQPQNDRLRNSFMQHEQAQYQQMDPKLQRYINKFTPNIQIVVKAVDSQDNESIQQLCDAYSKYTESQICDLLGLAIKVYSQQQQQLQNTIYSPNECRISPQITVYSDVLNSKFLYFGYDHIPTFQEQQIPYIISDIKKERLCFQARAVLPNNIDDIKNKLKEKSKKLAEVYQNIQSHLKLSTHAKLSCNTCQKEINMPHKLIPSDLEKDFICVDCSIKNVSAKNVGAIEWYNLSRDDDLSNYTKI